MEKSLNKNPIKVTTQRYKIIWVFSILSFLGISFPTQAFSFDLFDLKITVIDAKTGEPLIGATVATDDLGFSGTTDIDGKITLNGIGHLEMVNFSYIGYEDLSIPFNRIRSMKGNIKMVEAQNIITEVKVYGRRDVAKEEIPMMIDRISKESIAFSNSQTSADVLGNHAEVFIQKSQMGGGSPIIRGFEANKVLLVVDGVRMNNAIYREGHIQNSITLDNSILEQAEVIYGPSSLIYGSDALGGVVHFRTRDPKVLFNYDKSYELKTNANIRFSTANLEKSAHIDFDYATQKWGSVTSITYVNYEDLRAGANRPDEYPDFGKREYYVLRLENVDQWRKNSDPNIQRGTGYSQLDFLQKIKFQPSEKLYYVFNMQYSTSSDVPRYDMLNDTLSAANDLKWAEWYYGPQNRFLGSLKIKSLKSTALYDKTTIIGAYQRIDEDRFKRKFYSSHRTFNAEDVHVFSFTTDWAKGLGKNKQHLFSYGIDLAYNKVYSKAGNINVRTNAVNDKEFTRYPSDFSTMGTGGAYLNYRWRNRDSTINFTMGARYSYVELFAKYKEDDLIEWPASFVSDGVSTQNDEFTYASGLTINTKNGFQLHLLGGTAFRSPNINDFAINRVKDRNILVPNVELIPEKALNGEITLGKTFGKRAETGKYKISATGFYTYLQDAIIRSNADFFGDSTLVAEGEIQNVQKNINANTAYVTGFSGNIVFEFNKNWKLNSSINFVKGRSVIDSLEQPLAHIPPMYGKTSLSFQTDKIKLEGVVRFNDAKPLSEYGPSGSSDNDDEAIPGVGTLGWTTYNFYSSYRFNDRLTLNFAVENILDTHYRPFASGVSAAGRNFIVSMRGSF
ncbi:MAG: TonB-dependent receptor plug domain-containing protein [Saprospiraceae bacterium]